MGQSDVVGQERIRALGEARELRAFLVTVGDLVRLQVLRQLAQKQEMSVTELVQAVRVSQPLLSWHLSVLKRIGLVTVRRDGRLVWYALNRAALRGFYRRFAEWAGMDEDSVIEGGDADGGKRG